MAARKSGHALFIRRHSALLDLLINQGEESQARKIKTCSSCSKTNHTDSKLNYSGLFLVKTRSPTALLEKLWRNLYESKLVISFNASTIYFYCYYLYLSFKQQWHGISPSQRETQHRNKGGSHATGSN